jgi:hypothetical protein
MPRSAFKNFILLIGALISAATIAAADEGGVSFWLPGLFGSLAAVPQQAGWVAQHRLLARQRIGRRRCPRARDHDRQDTGQFERGPQCGPEVANPILLLSTRAMYSRPQCSAASLRSA